MRPTSATRSISLGKPRLLGSCAIAAGLTALAFAGPAQAQVAGSGQVVGPNPTTITTPGVTQVDTGGASQTIINWTPTDTAVSGAPIDFLPVGSGLEYYGTGQYTVLNRFIDSGGSALSRQIALNGTVNSYIGAPSNPNNVQGGNIWFYNAGGILIGGNAVMNVGSLLLTANDIDTSGGLFDATGNIRFRGASGSTSAIQISQGASITAANSNPGSSYVALVAPRIVQNGFVSTDGSTAYVAAEQADIRINNGLFDINVLVGAEGGNAITHSGTTTGPAHQQGDTNDNRIYMVAIPKNDAVTMLVSGQVGYQDAVSAQVDPDGGVVLSAGYNVTNGAIDSTPVNGTAADIRVNNTAFLSNIMAHASGQIIGSPQGASGAISVAGNATFIGDAGAAFSIGVGQQITSTGDFTVQANGTSAAPGNASLTLDGGLLDITRDLYITANGPVLADGSNRGGNASLVINAGTARTSDIFVAANATGGIGAGGDGGTANGGTASLIVDGTGSLFANNINVLASATGGGLFLGQSGLIEAVDNGGAAVGGTATLSVTNGGRISTIESVTVNASGMGQTGNIQSGNGTGGSASIRITGSGSDYSAAATQILATGTGGGSQVIAAGNDLPSLSGGDGTGGLAELVLDGDSSTFATLGSTYLFADALGGSSDGDGSRGGYARGGTATISATGGIYTNPDLLIVSTRAEGGRGTSPTSATAFTGDAIGGTINFTADTASSFASDSDISLDASGDSSFGENAGNSTGGIISVRASSGGTISALNDFDAYANGGDYDYALLTSIGNSTGGSVTLAADGGTISANDFSINTSAGTADVDGVGGFAQGGTIDLIASNNGLIESSPSFSYNDLAADGVTGYSNGGTNATGGTIRVIADGGQINLASFSNYFSANGRTGGNTNTGATMVTTGVGGTILIRLLDNLSASSAISLGSISISTDGYTGTDVEGAPPVDAPGAANAMGGNVTVDVQGGTLTGTYLDISSNGYGGKNDALGGGGYGGTATFTQSGGTVNVTDLQVSADGYGGYSDGAGPSGDGFGGTATINFFAGDFTAQDVFASADGIGSYGLDADGFSLSNQPTDGGNGIGGTATINLDGSATVTAQNIEATANGRGGDGGNYYSYSGDIENTGNGGDGTGGSANINLIQGTLNVINLTSDASGIGGNGGEFFDSSSVSGPPSGIGVGGDGGNGTGGTATITTMTAINSTGDVGSKAQGRGGDGGSNSIGGNGGSALGGLAQIQVTDFDAGNVYVNLDSRGFGGNGGAGQNGGGGNGGSATGGISRVQLDGQNSNVILSNANFDTRAFGGNGGDAALAFGNDVATGPDGGNGGDGTGGTLEVINNGGSVTLDIEDSGNSVDLDNTGTGGDGGHGADNFSQQGGVGGNGGNGGAGFGGTIHLLATAGTIDSGGIPINFASSGQSGDGGGGGFGGNGSGFSGISGYTGGGIVTFETQTSEAGSGLIDLDATSIDVSGDIAGRINILNDSDGVGISFASLDASAYGSPTTSSPTSPFDSGIYIASSNGQIFVDGDASLNSDGSIAFDMVGNGQFTASGSLDVFSNRLISATHLNPDNSNASVFAGSGLSLYSSGDIITDQNAQFSSGGDLYFEASQNIDIASADAAGDATLISSGSTNASSAFAGGNLYAEGGSVGLGFAGSGNSTTLIASGSDVSFGTINSGTSTDIDSFGGVFGGDITAGTDLTITAGADGQIDSMFAGDDINLDFAGALSIATMTTDGSGGDNEEDGSNVVITAGDTDIDHSETADNFTADVASFRTGLNSLITGGDINITAPGAVDLGNSTADGFIQVFGQSISFVALDAGSTVNLSASGTVPGAEGISGDNIVAGGSVSLFGNSIAVNNSLQSGGGLFASATGGAAAINGADTVGDISVFAEGDLSGSFVSGGNVDLQSNANINASATANGGFVNGNGGLSEGTVFVIAAGNATLTNSAAATMFGVNAGQAISVTNASAGEDMLLLAGTTAALTDVTAGDDVDVEADGPITVLRVSATGTGNDDRDLLFVAGGSTGLPSMFLTNATAADGADITLTSFNGAIGAATLTAGDDIILSASTTLALDGGTTLGVGSTDTGSSITTQSGDASFANLDAFDDIEIDSTGAASITGAVAAGRDMTVAADSVDMALLATSLGVVLDTLTIGRDLSITATNAITGGHSQAGGDLVFDAGTNIDILSASTGGGLLSLNGITGVFANTVSSGGETDLFSDAGAIQVNNLTSAGPVYAVGDSIAISGSNSLVFEQLDTDVGDAVVDTSGNLDVNASTVAGRADLSAGNNLDIVQLDANDVILAAGNDMTLSTVTASNVLQAEADQTINIMNGVTGRVMSVLSADIVIATNASLGTVNSTDTLDIRNNNSDNQTFIGGTGTRNGYHLDAAEMTRIFGSDITVYAPEVLSSGFQSVGSSAPPDVIIDDFVLTAGGPTSNLGPNGGFTILTPGKARVIGNASLTGLSDNNSFNLFADDAIEVIMGQGTIRLTGTGSTPAGMLYLQSDDIIVASSSAIADVAAAPNTDAIEARLAQNDGFTSDDGALFAGGISVNVVGGFYVQNSGTGTDFDQRRGLTFGALGFDIATASTTTRIVANGQQLGPNGTVNGLDTIALLNIGGGSGQGGGGPVVIGASFDPRSTFNGCLIANVASCGSPTTPVFPEVHDDFPVQDIIDNNNDDDPDDAHDGSGGILVPLIELRDIDPLPGEPLLDDPVTGAGNDDLWSAPAE